MVNLPLKNSTMIGFQQNVAKWAIMAFGSEIACDKRERCDRFIEEALELVQAVGYDRERAHALVDYVFDRPVGEVHQEAGGVMVTLAALAIVLEVDLFADGSVELARINTPEVMAKIREKQRTKPTGSALPGFSLNAFEAKIMRAFINLDAECALNYKGLAERTDLNIETVKVNTRALAKKGMLRYARGLMSDEGAVAGSGYGLTDEGSRYLRGLTS